MTMLAPIPAQAADSPEQKKQLEQTLADLQKTKEMQAALAEKEIKARRDLEQLQTHSAELAERLQVSERRVSKQESEFNQVNATLAVKQKEFDARRAEYTATVITLLRMRDLPMTALFAQPEQMHALLITAGVLEETNQAVAQKAAALRNDMAELRKLKEDVAARRKETQAETSALDAEQEKLAAAVRDRQKLQAQLSADRGRAEEKVTSLSRQSESLQTLIHKLDEQARAEQAKAKQTPPKPAKAPEKGSLRQPVAGSVIHKFGDQKSANETWRGLTIRTRPSATVVAPAEGEVVFAGPFRDYGNMLLIKHSNGYISMMSGLGKLSATLGQKVIRGEPVALTDTDAQPEVYVELRDSDAKPIDPGDWFARVSR